MRKSVMFIIAIFACIIITGCAHTGLVAGPKVTEPIIDRHNYIKPDPGLNKSAKNDFEKRAKEYADSRHIPEDMQEKLNGVNSSFLQAKEKIAIAFDQIKSNFHELDTSLPDVYIKTHF